MAADERNQPPPYEGRNLYLVDRALRAAVERGGASWAHSRLTEWGAALGSAEMSALAARANRFGPELRTHDRFGNRIDEVGFDPAWHELLMLAMIEGEHAAPWSEERAGAQAARAAAYLMHAEVENGTQCPLTMTFAAVPLLRRHADAMPGLADEWLPRILSRDYDPRALPVPRKTSALIGMGMTERQGGSDVRANTTRAEPVGGSEYRLTGHKWFFSAPMCDAHLVLAQAPKGLSCFFLPRVLPDGSRNSVRLQRLKDKLGNRSNASCEVEFDGAACWLLGDEGRGVQVIIEMVQHTRLDCAIGSAGLIRSAAAQALHHAKAPPRVRPASGRAAADAERTGRPGDRGGSGCCLPRSGSPRPSSPDAGESEAALSRLATPALKFWLCKRAPTVVAEAIEVRRRQRLRRGKPVAAPLPRSAAELDLGGRRQHHVPRRLARGASRTERGGSAAWPSSHSREGADTRLDRHVARLGATLPTRALDESGARRLARDIAVALAAALLVRSAAPAVSDAFCASRLGEGYAGALGTLPAGVDCAAVLAAAGD